MPVSNDSTFRLDAVIIGAQKAATSTLFERLRRHPHISGCRPKEPHHFIKDDWQTGMSGYARKFPHRHGRLTLEASTSYSFAHRSETAATRLHDHNPDMRILYVVRDPVARILSAYNHAVERGWLSETLEDVLQRSPRLMEDTRYATCLRPFRERFGMTNILVLTFDQVVHMQDDAVARTISFLGLPAHRGVRARANISDGSKRHHAHDGHRAMTAFARFAPRLYTRLAKPTTVADATLREEKTMAIRRALAPEIRQIEHLTGLDLAHWR